MGFSRPTLQQIIDRIANDFVAKISGATTFAQRSILRIMAVVYGGAVHLLYGYLDRMAKELFAKTATADADGGKLDTIGFEYGILRKSASPATGIAVVTGSAGTLIAGGTVLVSSAGIQYVTDSDAIIGLSGTTQIYFTSLLSSSDTNDVGNIVLTFQSPIAGVQSQAIVSADGITGGTDIETDDAYRERILARKQLAPHGGAGFDLVAWAKEVVGVSRAWVYPQYNGAGTVALFFVSDAQTPITPSAQQITDVTAHLIEHTDINGMLVGIPVTMKPGLFVSAPVLTPITFDIKLSPNTATIQDGVQAQLADLIYRDAYPGNTIYNSQIMSAIMATPGIDHAMIVTPGGDITMAYNAVGTLQPSTWEDYI